MIKKIRLAFIAAAIVLAVGGAYATKPALAGCENQQQYYWNGSGYVATGTYGVSYICMDQPSTCTFYKPNPVSQPNVYVPCRTGVYVQAP